MTYQATVVRVMIASPGDVEAERAMIRKVILDWNDLHSSRSQTVLLPVAWETHSAPQTGEPAQTIINRDLLSNCDLLVAVFWTRLGSPTGRAPSGTVEEIREHIEAGKQAMIYFSSKPVHPDSVDSDQYGAVKEFQAECKERGLIGTFESTAGLGDQFQRQLTLVVEKHFGHPQGQGLEIDLSSRLRSRGPELSREAQALLKAAAGDSGGHILQLNSISGSSLEVGERVFTEPGDPRSEAVWLGALKELRALGLVAQRDSKGELFTLSREGYNIADSFP